MLTRISIILLIISALIFTINTSDRSEARMTPQVHQTEQSVDSPIIKPSPLQDTFKQRQAEYRERLEGTVEINKTIVNQQKTIVTQTDKVDHLVSKAIVLKDSIFVVDTIVLSTPRQNLFQRIFNPKR
jgi:hypothetical protein